MDILKNDVMAVINEKINSISARNEQYSKFQPGPDKQISMIWTSKLGWIRNNLNNTLCVSSLPTSGPIKPTPGEDLFIPKSEVISLRTSKKILPGKKLAIYIGVVISVLILSYNLTKNLPFIFVSDKEGIFKLTRNLSEIDYLTPIAFLYSLEGLYLTRK